MHIVGISGSLRKGSYNILLLKTALSLVPEGVTTETADIGELPLYNFDVEQPSHPDSVIAFKSVLAKADAFVIATPEYNYSMPGGLKNAIDWASRPPNLSPLFGKPLAIMSASTSLLGGARAQYHLRQTCVFLDMHPLNRPEVMVSKAQEKFDAEGNL